MPSGYTDSNTYTCNVVVVSAMDLRPYWRRQTRPCWGSQRLPYSCLRNSTTANSTSSYTSGIPHRRCLGVGREASRIISSLNKHIRAQPCRLYYIAYITYKYTQRIRRYPCIMRAYRCTRNNKSMANRLMRYMCYIGKLTAFP